jgi:hypothetical protein
MRRIRSLDGLMQAARRRRAVVVPSRSNIRMPAAFVMGMPAALVWRYIVEGLYIYRRANEKQVGEGE